MIFKWLQVRKRKIQLARLLETINDLETKNFPEDFVWNYGSLNSCLIGLLRRQGKIKGISDKCL